MSVFPGKLLEYPSVSLDRFDKDNLHSSAYFLSHCHWDHMVGLDSLEFSERILKLDFKIYCHPVSLALLSAMPSYQNILGQICPLDCGQHTIFIPATVDSASFEVEVSIIPAGHCPGSVMFLLCGNAGNVLYTGDFRFKIGDSYKLKPIFDDNGSLALNIKSVYVDTTFFIPGALFIPSREDCLTVIVDAVRDWCSREMTNVVHISTKYNFGYESILIKLASAFKTKIHVTQQQFEKYRHFDQVRDVLTTTGASTKIHFCNGSVPTVQTSVPGQTTTLRLTCTGHSTSKLLQIKPAVMYFATSYVTPTEMVRCERENVIRICYSTHSSYSEIADFLFSLKPRFVHPNVIPPGFSSLNEVRTNLKRFEQLTQTSSLSPLPLPGKKRRGLFRKLSFLDDGHSEPVCAEPVCSDPIFSEPPSSKPVCFEPVCSEPNFSVPPSEPVCSEPNFSVPPSETVCSQPVCSNPSPSPSPLPDSDDSVSTVIYFCPNSQDKDANNGSKDTNSEICLFSDSGSQDANSEICLFSDSDVFDAVPVSSQVSAAVAVSDIPDIFEMFTQLITQ